MDNKGAGTGAVEVFALSQDEQVGPDQGAPVRRDGSRQVRRRRNLGTHVIGMGPIKIWFESGVIKMRRHGKRVVETLSVEEAWHTACGQKEMRLR